MITSCFKNIRRGYLITSPQVQYEIKSTLGYKQEAVIQVGVCKNRKGGRCILGAHYVYVIVGGIRGYRAP